MQMKGKMFRFVDSRLLFLMHFIQVHGLMHGNCHESVGVCTHFSSQLPFPLT